jgi:hypothetical protein
VHVQAKGFSALGTQLYPPDVPENACNFLSRQLDPAGRMALTLPLGRGRSSARVELVLA